MRVPGVRRRGKHRSLVLNGRSRSSLAPRAAGGRSRRSLRPRSLLVLLFMVVLVLSPMGVASAAPPPLPNPNDACSPADHPSPEQYGSGIDGMLKPPNYPTDRMKKAQPGQISLYDRYGTEGQTWYAVDMGCSDAMAMVGNSVSNVVFTLAKAFDRTTITVYQAAASESLLGWLKSTVDGVIRGIGNTFGAKYWSWVVILGALWLAWWGLIHRRASKVAEGTIWMVMAMVGLIWLIGRPGDFTTLGTKVSNGATAAFNAALPQSNASANACVPGPDLRQTVTNDAVTRNANGLWVTLVCKPWVMGEFGTDDVRSKIVQQNGAKLLSSQAVDLSETFSGNKADLGKKANDYKAVAQNVKNNFPGDYPLFQGKNWTSRLAVSFGALLAALVAGLLVLLIAVLLIVLKISFLLLLVAGPVFLGIGIHPGVGRVIAVRWFELLLSTLLKQAALIGVLALLLWAYGLVMAESLPWGLQILLISLVTLAAFIYRKPFQHLFAAVGYSAVGSRKSEEHLEKAVHETRKRTTAVATAAVPGTAGYRFGRWGRRDTGNLPAALDEQRDSDPAAREAGAGTGADRRSRAPQLASRTGADRAGAPPLNLSPRSPQTSSGGRSNGGRVAPRSPRPSGSPHREERRPAGGGTRPPSAPTGPSWTAGGRGGSGGEGSGGRTPPQRTGGGEGSGRGWFGGGDRDGGRGSGGGRSWFGGRSAPQRGSPKGSTRDPASAARGRADAGGGGNAGGRPAPPPLWSGRGGDDAPAIPFWLRPVRRDDGDDR
jgi:hypothetical protein